MSYLGFLSDEGLVHETSLNPYLAAIYQAHEDTGLPRPVLGHYLTLLRKGVLHKKATSTPTLALACPSQ